MKVYWLEEPTILSVDFEGMVTAPEVKNAIYQCLAELEHHPAHFLIDLAEGVNLPAEVVEMAAFNEWVYHPNARWFVYVRVNGLLKSLVQMRHRGSCRLFDDRADAEAFLLNFVSGAASRSV